MDLSIIIVNWNSVEFLRKCLATVRAETRRTDYEIIVIDSASYDGCDRMLREQYPGVRFIQSKENLGFARANNVAFRASRGRHVLFLNPDTEVVGPAIDVMLDHLRTLPHVGAVGCKLLNVDRTIQTSCIQSVPTILNQMLDCEFLRARWPKSKLWGMSPLYEEGARPRVVEAISGACVMLKREVFERIGLFSEDYFMYAEDIDLSYKARQAGLQNYYVPDATVIHINGGSSQVAPSGFAVVTMRESIWRFLRKFRGSLYAFGYRGSTAFASLFRLALTPLVIVSAARNRDKPGRWRAYFGKWGLTLRWALGLPTAVK